MVGEVVGATLEVDCSTCLVESEISKWMGAKEIEPEKSRVFFFSKISCRSHGIHITLKSNSPKET